MTVFDQRSEISVSQRHGLDGLVLPVSWAMLWLEKVIAYSSRMQLFL